MRNSYAHLFLIPLLLTMCLAESYSALTAFGSSSTQNQQQNADKHGSRRTRECKSDEECAAIQNTTCMSDPRDYKMRCLCRDSSAPINGACPNRPREKEVFCRNNTTVMVQARTVASLDDSRRYAVGSPCKMDNECIEGSECKSLNITVTSFKTCQCKDGYMSKDGYCSSGFQIPAPSLIFVFAGTLTVLLTNKLSIKL